MPILDGIAESIPIFCTSKYHMVSITCRPVGRPVITGCRAAYRCGPEIVGLSGHMSAFVQFGAAGWL